MNSDIRVSVTLLQHHKTKKLIRLLGLGVVYYLLRLWTYTAQYRPDGVLKGMTAEDIAVAIDWMDEPDDLIRPLCEIGFLEQCEKGGYIIHDWVIHNPYAAHAKDRSEKARKAAQARWGNAKQCSEHATSIPPVSPSNAPIPIPTPSPIPKDTDDSDDFSGPRPKACPVEPWEEYLTYSQHFLERQHERWGANAPISDSRVIAGARALDKLIRVKGFSSKVVYETVEWGRDHHFWQHQLKSLGALTKKGRNDEIKFNNILSQRAKEASDAQRHAQ